MLKSILILAVFVYLLVLPILTVASEGVNLKEAINPDNGFNYTIKRLGEKIQYQLLFDNKSKAKYDEEISRRRLAELKYIVDQKDSEYIETVSQRYFTAVGNWTNFIIQNDMKDEKKNAKEILNKHKKLLHELLNAYNDTTAQWRFVKHTYDYINIYISKL